MAGTFMLVGAEEIQSSLKASVMRMMNPRQFLAAAGEIVVASVERNFQEGGRPNKWRSLAAATLKARSGGRKAKGGPRVLIRTGRLKNSISATVSGDAVKVGTSVIYAAIHQFGGTCGAGHKVVMPARPFLMVQDDDWAEIQSLGRKYFLGGERQ